MFFNLVVGLLGFFVTVQGVGIPSRTDPSKQCPLNSLTESHLQFDWVILLETDYFHFYGILWDSYTTPTGDRSNLDSILQDSIWIYLYQ